MGDWKAGDLAWQIQSDDGGVPRGVEIVKLTSVDAGEGMGKWVYPAREDAVAEMRRRLAKVEAGLVAELARVRELMGVA